VETVSSEKDGGVMGSVKYQWVFSINKR